MRLTLIVVSALVTIATTSLGQTPGVRDSSLAQLDLRAATELVGSAPSAIVGTVSIRNRGASPVGLEFGACAVDLLAFRTPDKTGSPAWVSNPSGMCILPLYVRTIAPGDTTSLHVTVHTHDMMKEPIPGGRYFFTTQVELNRKKFTLDGGALVIPGSEERLPVTRTFGGIEFSSVVTRVRKPNAPDSLEVAFAVYNKSTKSQRLTASTVGNPECVYMMGYDNQANRDSYYSRPAYEANWLARPCPLRIADLNLEPGERRILRGRTLAPAAPMHYVLGIEFWSNGARTPEPDISLDLSADENTHLN